MTDARKLERILCVDDEPDIRKILTMSLEFTLSAEVIAVSSASEALSYLERHPVPDAIVVDGMMPGMSGMELCAHLRRDGRFGNVPIVFLSAQAQPDEQQRAIDAGATTCIAKPFDPMQIGEQIRAAVMEQA